jgi:hypothetical protein
MALATDLVALGAGYLALGASTQPDCAVPVFCADFVKKFVSESICFGFCFIL